jgi:transposase InsO family protein
MASCRAGGFGGTGEHPTGQVGRQRRRKPRYAVRKPKGYKVEAPGDLVQVDTLHVRLVANQMRFHFSAWDTAVKYGAFRAYRRQTSTAAADFLHHLKTKFPFPIKAIQIDGGSEFKDQFEEACRRRKIRLFLNPPRCPELNGGVERSNRTSREEFYEVEDLALTMEELNRQLEGWEHTYNCVRPHQALDYRTPNEYYRRWKTILKSQVSLMP